MNPENINYRSLCVTKQKDECLYPKSIPKERGLVVIYITIFVCLFLFLVDLFTDTSPFSTILMHYSLGFTFSIIIEIIYRTILMYEEYHHLTSRYDRSIITLLKDTYYFHRIIWVMVIFCFTFCVYFAGKYGLDLGEITYLKLGLVVTIIFLVGKILRLSDSPLNDSLWVAENNGLDYGSGMAYSFFHGYLKLVLAKTGTADKNLEEIIRDYEDRNGVTFAAYKLFILIPKSMTCFVSLMNEFSPSIEESSSLEEKVITVAGVQNRVYKNAVYKIVLENGNRYYVAAEYATPLKTFKDVFDITGVHSASYNKLKKDIILQFYLTLEKVLEDRGLSQFCELIYFEDSYQNSNGQLCHYDVGKIIQTRLKDLRRRI